MKKRLFTLIATLVLVFAFSVSCFAKSSPTSYVLPTDITTGDGSGEKDPNKDPISPQTGADWTFVLSFATIAIAGGFIVLSKTKLSKLN